jgi:hypothetical protein
MRGLSSRASGCEGVGEVNTCKEINVVAFLLPWVVTCVCINIQYKKLNK